MCPHDAVHGAGRRLPLPNCPQRALLAFCGYVRTDDLLGAGSSPQLEQSVTTAKFNAALEPTAAPSAVRAPTPRPYFFLPALPTLPVVPRLDAVAAAAVGAAGGADAAASFRASLGRCDAAVAAAAVGAARVADAAACSCRRCRRRPGAGDARRRRSHLRRQRQGRRAPARRVRARGARRRDRRRDRRQGAVQPRTTAYSRARRTFSPTGRCCGKQLLASYLTASFTTGLLWDCSFSAGC